MPFEQNNRFEESHSIDLFWDIDEEQILNASETAHYEIALDAFFNARHYVTMNGVRGAVHAHSYRVRVRCQSYALDPDDHVVVGYAALRDRLAMIVKAYNNQCLNDLPPFRLKKLQTTTENLTAVIFQQLERSLEGLAVKLIEVAIWESPTNSITYSKSTRYVRRA
ncbi:MAG TPA: 6-carboxytetrahydropterin synthase [Anaerolineales bacterium]|nr:6-carboxytetrahydropterin synthase [Anaerolineales bacterium]